MAENKEIWNLIKQLANDDESALQDLMKQIGARVLKYCLKFTNHLPLAEELAQDVFYKLWINRKKLPEVKSFKGFLYILTRNVCFDYLRKTSKEKKLKEDFFFHYDLAHNDVDEYLQETEMMNLFKRAVENLPPRQKEVFILSRDENMTYQEIADQLNISPKTVQEHLVRATKKLRNQLMSIIFPILLVIFWIYLY